MNREGAPVAAAAVDVWHSDSDGHYDVDVPGQVDLAGGQPGSDPHFSGATPADYIQGEGITCDQPPAGWTQQGWAGYAGRTVGPGAVYQFFAPAT